MDGETKARIALAFANYVVAALNIAAAVTSLALRDWVAAIAWIGSGSFWLWSAVQNEEDSEKA